MNDALVSVFFLLQVTLDRPQVRHIMSIQCYFCKKMYKFNCRKIYEGKMRIECGDFDPRGDIGPEWKYPVWY